MISDAFFSEIDCNLKKKVNEMKFHKARRSTFLIVLPVGLMSFLYIFSQLKTSDGSIDLESGGVSESIFCEKSDKQRGAHIFGELDSVNLLPFVRSNYDWITLVSWAAQDDFDSPVLGYFRGDSIQAVRRDSMWKSQIDLAHAAGFKVFLKPHLWLTDPSGGKWRSDVFPANENDWEQWQKIYRDFILLYARIAEENNVELYCIGTELSRLSAEKPDFWRKLIVDVRTVYSGKITYAANWYDEFENITFWDELDFIGIQAYFPLVKNEYPSVQQISRGWKKYIPAMKTLHERYNRQILFTEMGYKSTPDSAIEPWRWLEYSYGLDDPVSNETQANCYEAFFNTIWNKKWFAGVHIWQLRSDYEGLSRDIYLDFTPQGKPAEHIIAKGFD